MHTHTHTHTAPSMHPMDCTDIIIGVARGEQFRVFDYYTRDRATPRRDRFYGGEESLTAAVGKEVDGFTFIKWRRPLGELCVVYMCVII